MGPYESEAEEKEEEVDDGLGSYREAAAAQERTDSRDTEGDSDDSEND